MSDDLLEQAIAAAQDAPSIEPIRVHATIPRVHTLNTWPEYWDAVRSGRKTFEARRNDRGFRVGDILELLRWCPHCNDIAPAADGVGMARRRIEYILTGGQFGIEPGFVVLGIREL